MADAKSKPAATSECLEKRPSLPTAIAKQLRQEAWFGCCACGGPLIEFHHILGWKRTLHDPAHMLALCPTCHAEADGHGFDEIDQYEMKANPFNKRAGLAGGVLSTARDSLVVALGENYLFGADYRISAEGETLFSARVGARNDLVLTLSLYDEQDQLVMHIVDNEWLLGAELASNLIVRPRYLRIESPLMPKGFEIDARDDILKLRGTLRRRGMEMRIEKLALRFSGNPFVVVGMLWVDTRFDLLSTGAVRLSGEGGKPACWTSFHGRHGMPGFASYLRVLGESARAECNATVTQE